MMITFNAVDVLKKIVNLLIDDNDDQARVLWNEIIYAEFKNNLEISKNIAFPFNEFNQVDSFFNNEGFKILNHLSKKEIINYLENELCKFFDI